jgi:starch-binding outer membrane protein, SusD/RagB family
MNKIIKYSKFLLLGALVIAVSACEDFLNRPPEDSFTIDNFYQTDEQCFQAANMLYNAPWYDFQRGFIDIGDVMAGNVFKGTDNIYQSFNLNSTNDNLVNASNSLWLVNGHCNAVIENVAAKAGPSVSQQTKNTVTGEAMAWKATAYFFLVRGWGAVPIVHSNSDIIGNGTALQLKKNRVEDVYEYIIRTYEKAAELLPEKNADGRLNKYSAYGMLAKVYLYKSGYGRSGDRNQADLDKAKFYASKVINESGAVLEPVYYNLFRMSTGNRNPENLMSWQWVVSDRWTSQNSLQSDLALSGFTGINDSWGTWTGISIDLQNLFNEDARNKNSRANNDARRKATMMMVGDHYPLWWRHLGGFTATWNDDNIAEATFGVGTGANFVKHIVGHYEDHNSEIGYPAQRMATSLSTHILRLADVYLIYAEAILGNNETTSDPEALKYYNAVRARSINPYTPATSFNLKNIYDERRRELATEGDNWYDYVRLHYYKPQLAKDWINAQERGSYGGLTDFYKNGTGTVTLNSFKVNITDDRKFRLPFPEVDLSMNPNLADNVEPVEFDFSTIPY